MAAKSKPSPVPGLVLGAGLVAAAGAGLAAILRRSSPPAPAAPPRRLVPSAPAPPQSVEVDLLDVLAAARMIASENPHGPEQAKVEQIHAKLRARRKGQSFYNYATGGHGWGKQGRGQDGHFRLVSTEEEATAKDFKLAKEVVSGQRPSILPQARTFFDPDQQDRVYRQVQQGLKDLAAGRAVSKRTRDLLKLGYQKTAQQVREGWAKSGQKYVGTIGPVEFWT